MTRIALLACVLVACADPSHDVPDAPPADAAGDAPATTAPRLTPVLGWNHWYAFRCAITEDIVLAQAHALVDRGLAAAGYDLVALDDCWMASARAADGSLAWDPAKFPHGMPWLADQIHALGLHLGVYEAAGTTTCQRLPGSHGHYAQDAGTFASWGIDFVKLDYCGYPASTPKATLTADFEAFGAALRAANPAILYSQELPICCTVGSPEFLQAVMASSTFANMWRVAADEKATDPAATTILAHLQADLHLHAFARPGHWNDLDMVLTGNPKFGWTLAEEQSQLAVWAIEASPLLVSSDLTQLSAAELAALRNPHLIEIDGSGQQAARQIADGAIWAVIKPDPRGGLAVLLLNTGSVAATGSFTPAQLGLAKPSVRVTDVWTDAARTVTAVTYPLDPGATALVQVE